eukprot:m51a1_g6197 hypothetical protein (260) ;mRNA; f:104080-105368
MAEHQQQQQQHGGNGTIELLNTHACTRAFTSEEVSEADLAAVVEAAHRCATSVNGQQVSVVVFRSQEARDRIAAIAGGQPWIARAPVFLLFVADFYKTSVGVESTGSHQVIHESLEGWTVAAVDAGIALEAAMAAARALGLGVVPIGGIRRDPQAMIDLAGLPPKTFPLVGLSLGHPQAAPTLKPRMGIATFRHDERYDAGAALREVPVYDAQLAEHWEHVGRSDGQQWSRSIAQFYTQIYFPKVQPVAQQQGLVSADK